MKKKILLTVVGILVIGFGAYAGFAFWPSNQASDGSGTSDSGKNNFGQEMYFATLTVDGTVVRDGGMGSCGVEPWIGDCKEYRIWWGQSLTAAFEAELVIVPDGEGRWVITNNADVLKKYTFLPKDLSVYNADSGFYRFATPAIDFGSTMGCSGAIKMTAEKFATQVMGVATNGYVKLVISPKASETISGKCGDIDVLQVSTVWRWGVSAALAKDPEDMTVVLGTEEFIPVGSEENSVSYYRKETKTDTNPSPQPRDHVEANLMLVCKDANDQRIDCPWNK